MRSMLIIVCGLLLFACTKDESFAPAVGGELPTNYVMIQDSGFSPSSLVVASGSSVTFVNNTGIPHNIMSHDSTSIISTTVESNTSYFYKNDTVGTITYYCTTHPIAQGSITFTP